MLPNLLMVLSMILISKQALYNGYRIHGYIDREIMSSIEVANYRSVRSLGRMGVDGVTRLDEGEGYVVILAS